MIGKDIRIPGVFDNPVDGWLCAPSKEVDALGSSEPNQLSRTLNYIDSDLKTHGCLVEEKRSKMLWDVDSGFHCSIVGTCFTLKSLRRIARKVRLNLPENATDYQIHSVFVSAASRHGPAAKEMQKELRRRYGNVIARFAKAENEEELADLWGDARAQGEIAGPYWAVMTHPELTSELQYRAFAEVHMLSHLSGASARADIRELEDMKGRNRALVADCAAALERARRAVKERDEYAARMSEYEADAEAARSQLAEVSERIGAHEECRLAAEVRRLRAELEAESRRVRRTRAEGDRFREKNSTLKERLIQLERERSEYRMEREALENQLERLLECSSNCPAYDAARCPRLCGRCVLYVGGRQGVVKHFRMLVEKGGGKLLHHDGGIEDACPRLAGCIAQADAVLMPTTCVSHEASLKVKRNCKRHRKPLVYLRSSGLSAFVGGLSRLAPGPNADSSG